MNNYVGTSTGDTTNKDYYVYVWKIKETGEIFYVGKGRGDRAYVKHDKAYEAEKIKRTYETEVEIIYENLSEEEALILEDKEMRKILNQTNDILTNRIIPFAKRDNGYGKAKSAPEYKFETASMLYASEIDEHYFGIKHRCFDCVEMDGLLRPHFIEKSIFGEELEIVYAGNYQKYLDEVNQYLKYLGYKQIKSKYAKNVTSWIYSTGGHVIGYENDQNKALERIGKTIPAYHLIDVWKYLKNEVGIIEIIEEQEVVLEPKHTRVDLREIKNINNRGKGFDEGYSYFEEGESLRKSGELYEALDSFDKARYLGYNAPALYKAYAKLFRKQELYDDEISILNEGLSRLDEYGVSKEKVERDFKYRIQRAMDLKLKQEQTYGK